MSLISKNGLILSGIMWLALLPFCLFYTVALSIDSLYGGAMFKVTEAIYVYVWVYYAAIFWFLACNARRDFLAVFCEKYPFISKMAMSVGWIVNLVLGFWIVEELLALLVFLLHFLGLSFLSEYFESMVEWGWALIVGNTDNAEGAHLMERNRMVLFLVMTFISLMVFFVRAKLNRRQDGEKA